MDNVIRDFSEWNIPTSWDGVTLRMFQDLQRFYGENEDYDMRDVIRIFSQKTMEEVNALPVDFLETMLLHLSFLREPMEEGEPTNRIEIDGEEYVVNTMEKMRTGEYVDSQMAISQDRFNTAAVLAIVCRKKGEQYDSDFIANKYDDRVAMFESQSITRIMPMVAFFLRLHMISQMPSLLSSAMEREIDHIVRHIENSPRGGVGKRLSTRYQVRTLKRLKRRLRDILRTS